MYYVYIIRCDDNSLYTGIATNIEKRIKEHYYKTPKCAKYTRARDVVSLEAVWTTDSRSNASKLEYYIKHLTKTKKEDIISNPMQIDNIIYQYQKGITLAACLKENV